MHKPQSIPQAEQADMALSPVSEEEMVAAMKDALAAEPDVMPKEMPREMPDIERADIATSPVTEKEMREAREAIEAETFAGEKNNNNEGVLDKEATDIGTDDAGKIRKILDELNNIPPGMDVPQGEKDPGMPRRMVTGARATYRRCEVCNGSGKKYWFFNCENCGGRGTIMVTYKEDPVTYI